MTFMIPLKNRSARTNNGANSLRLLLRIDFCRGLDMRVDGETGSRVHEASARQAVARGFRLGRGSDFGRRIAQNGR